jgi:hypothetical protein
LTPPLLERLIDYSLDPQLSIDGAYFQTSNPACPIVEYQLTTEDNSLELVQNLPYFSINLGTNVPKLYTYTVLAIA